MRGEFRKTDQDLLKEVRLERRLLPAVTLLSSEWVPQKARQYARKTIAVKGFRMNQTSHERERSGVFDTSLLTEV